MKDYMNECCEKCRHVGWNDRNDFCLDTQCFLCHSNSTKKRDNWEDIAEMVRNNLAAPHHTSPEKEMESGWTKILIRAEETAAKPPFTEKTPDPAEYVRAGKALGILEGKRQERSRILTLIENKKKEIHEVDSESFGWDLLGSNTSACCPGDDAAYAYELALTSLAAELQDA